MGANPSILIRIAATVEELKKNLKEGRDQIEVTTAGMSKLVNSFTGEKLVQHARNVTAAIDQVGASTLTASEAARNLDVLERAMEKLTRTGGTVPSAFKSTADQLRAVVDASTPAEKATDALNASFGRLTAAFAVGSLIENGVSSLASWGAEAIAAAGHTVNLADKTGLSTTAIQQMAHVAAQTGTSVETFTNAAIKLGVSLSGGNASVRDAVADLGLEFNTLRGMRPEQQFDAITTALAGMESPQERNRLALQLFGKAGADLLPAIAQGYGRIASEATISGEAQLRAVDAATNAWAKFKTDAGSAIVSYIGNVVLLGKELAHLQLSMLGVDKQAELFGESIKGGAAAQDGAARVSVDYAAKLASAQAELGALNDEQVANAETAKRLGATTEEITDQFGLSAEAQQLLTERMAAGKKEQSESAAAAKKHADAIEEVASAGDGWRGTLEGMNAEMVKAIKGYIDAGVSQSALAEVYGLTATQISAVAKAMAEEDKAVKIADRAFAQSAKLRAENAALEMSMSGTVRDTRIADIEAEFRAEIAILTRKGELTRETEAELTRQRDLKIQKESADFALLNSLSRSALEERAEYERATYEAMAARVGEFSAGTLAIQKERYLEATDAARNWRESQEREFDQSGKAVKSLEGTWSDGFRAMSESVEETLRRAGRLKQAVEEIYTMDIKPMDSLQQQQVALDFRNAGDSEETALWRALKTLEGQEGRVAPKDNMQYFQLQADQALLASLRQWAKGRERPPGFANGVTDFEGGIARVHRDELLVNLPKGTDVIPASKAGSFGAGGNVTIAPELHFHGTVVGTSREFKDTVTGALLDVLRSGAVALPTRI